MNTKKNIPLSIVVVACFLVTVFTFVQVFGTSTIYAEDDYNENLKEQLLLDLPEVTENPNHAVTFTDPTEKGVTLAVDGKTAVKITSPYKLPTLGIGEHDLVFKFYDTEEVAQTLEEEIVIIPRAPIIEIPQISKTALILKGTGVASGVVEIFVTDGIQSWRSEELITMQGAWEYKLEEEFEFGRYSTIAIARKSGYASRYSEIAIAELVDTEAQDGQSSQDTVTQFSFANIMWKDLPDMVQKSLVVDVLLLISIALGVGLGYLFRLFGSSKDSRKAKNLLQTMLEQTTDHRQVTKHSKKVETQKASVREILENGDISGQKPDSSKQKTKKADDKKKPSKKSKPMAQKGSKAKAKKKTAKKSNGKNMTAEASTDNEARFDDFDDFRTDAKMSPRLTEQSKSTRKETKSKVKKGKNRGNVLTRLGFLKKFEEFDPDDDKGKEKRIIKKSTFTPF